jgi:hypothetical protein
MLCRITRIRWVPPRARIGRARLARAPSPLVPLALLTLRCDLKRPSTGRSLGASSFFFGGIFAAAGWGWPGGRGDAGAVRGCSCRASCKRGMPLGRASFFVGWDAGATPPRRSGGATTGRMVAVGASWGTQAKATPILSSKGHHSAQPSPVPPPSSWLHAPRRQPPTRTAGLRILTKQPPPSTRPPWGPQNGPQAFQASKTLQEEGPAGRR